MAKALKMGPGTWDRKPLKKVPGPGWFFLPKNLPAGFSLVANEKHEFFWWGFERWEVMWNVLGGGFIRLWVTPCGNQSNISGHLPTTIFQVPHLFWGVRNQCENFPSFLIWRVLGRMDCIL